MDTQNVTEVQFKKSKKLKREKATYKYKVPSSETDMSGINPDNEKRIKKKKEGKSKKKKRKSIEPMDHSLVKKSKDESTNVSINEDDSRKQNNENTETSKELSKRKLKKQKIEHRQIEQRNINRMNTIQNALNYIFKWKHSRNEWKFEKIKQIWLIDNLLDGNSIPDTIFPTVLEYFEGCKGMAREILLKKGMDIIKKAEQENEENKDEIVESVAYKRARQLLQALPMEA